ncbi:hypothetical protein CBF30_06785 [Vagococcus entomophilus]|uniref:Calcineurin-like phosphoesterase domain-containing protein n=1 Tax=Vagococcus entomophilus TaxID=1160095 RepID=A0A430AGD7_9ENTE|nr:hypothetical protein CBF30_06785 [Vagococcus entomophilus]
MEKEKGGEQVKFVHTADLHLERPFAGVGNMPIEVLEKLQYKDQHMLEAIINYALKEQVDFVLFSGDTFHQPHVTIKMQAFFMQQLTRLDEQNIPVVLIFGNHDYYASERYWFSFPKNVYLFDSEQVQTLVLETKTKEKVALTGFSYENRWIQAAKIQEFPVRSREIDYQIGLYHGQIRGGDQKEHYAPFSVAELKEKGYDYWALGHIHQPMVLSKSPLSIYPGTPMGHTKKEQALRGVVLVEIQKEHTRYRWQAVTDIAFEQVELELKEVDTPKQIISAIQEKMSAHSLSVSDSFQFVTLKLRIGGELSQEIQNEIETPEFLSHIQQIIFRMTGETIWLTEIRCEWQQQEGDSLLPIVFSSEDFKQIIDKYEKQAFFEELMAPLYQQPILRDLLACDEASRSEIANEAIEQVKQQLGMGVKKTDGN